MSWVFYHCAAVAQPPIWHMLMSFKFTFKFLSCHKLYYKGTPSRCPAALATFNITTHSKIAFMTTTHSTMTFSTTFSITIKCDTRHNDNKYNMTHVFMLCHLWWMSLMLGVSNKYFILSVHLQNDIWPKKASIDNYWRCNLWFLILTPCIAIIHV